MTAVSTSNVSVLKVTRKVVGAFLQGLPAKDFDVSDYEDEVDWMSSLLSSPLFEFIPPANIQTLFSKFEEIEVKRSELGAYILNENGFSAYVLNQEQASA